jgi:PIN domain nuclease of toxin-antitoxin system
MRVLLDTHVLFWWFEDASKLSKRTTNVISNAENSVLVSAASAWELAIKANLGKLDAIPLVMTLDQQITEAGFEAISISLEQAMRAGLLPMHHRDPFDRLLVAQAQDLNVPILSSDTGLDKYDVKRLW